MGMVNMYQLWVPILVASLIVFMASSIIWMVLPYHKKDIGGTPDERSLLDSIRRQKLMPGQYFVPFTSDQAQRRSPEFIKKMEEGPVALITVMPAGVTNMGAILTKYFIFLVLINATIAYVARLALHAGDTYMFVFRFVGTVAFLAYGGAHAIYGIFWGRPWRIVWLDIMDAFIYGMLVAGSFGWRWPR